MAEGIGASLLGLPGTDVGAAVGELVTEFTSFTKFKQRVDELIDDLKGSPADARRIGQEPLTRAQFGGDGGSWGAASGLFDAYHSVLKDLESLSKLLSDSLEGMGIAVVASHRGYQNLDEDVRDRVKSIYAETSRHYDEQPPGLQVYGRNPYAEYDHGHGQQPADGPTGGAGHRSGHGDGHDDGTDAGGSI
jgi:hypothetical protein